MAKPKSKSKKYTIELPEALWNRIRKSVEVSGVKLYKRVAALLDAALTAEEGGPR